MKDKDYVLKELGLSEEEFERILARKPKSFKDYPTNFLIIKRLRLPILIATRLKLLPQIMYDKYF